MGYWDFNGTNGLKGVADTVEVINDCPPPGGPKYLTHHDPDNPAVLSDMEILNALRTSRRARFDFRKVYPTLLPEEQERLTALLEANPRVSQLILDDQRFADGIQSTEIRSIPVRTSGRRGGKGMRGA